MKIATEEWFFRRADGFYVIDVPIGQSPAQHAQLNPGTLEIRRVKTGELLWGEADAAAFGMTVEEAARVKAPPCMECGAKNEQEAERLCNCSGDKDNCHGCELWP